MFNSRNKLGIANRAIGYLFVGSTLLGVASVASAVTVSVPLTLAPPSPTANELDLTATAFIVSDSDTTTLTGTVASQLELTLLSEGIVVTGIRFDGGAISASDVAFDLIFASASVTGAGGNLATPNPGFSPVTGGQFGTADHVLTLDQGLVTADAETIDLSVEPFQFSSATDVASLTVQEIAANGAERTFGVTSSIPINETIPTDSGVTLSALGNVVAIGTFTVELPAAGDFNGDGHIDVADYTLWRDAYTTGGRPLSDYLLWKTNFGTPAPSGGLAAGRTSVPEPVAAVLLASGMLVGPRRRRE